MWNADRVNAMFNNQARQFLERPIFFGQKLPHFNNQQNSGRPNPNFGFQQGNNGGGSMGGGNNRQNFMQNRGNNMRGPPQGNQQPRNQGNNTQQFQGGQGGPIRRMNNQGAGGINQNQQGMRRNMNQGTPRKLNNQQQGNAPNKQQQNGTNNFANNKRKIAGQNQQNNKRPKPTPAKAPIASSTPAKKAAPATPAVEKPPVGSFRVAVTHPSHPFEQLNAEKLAATEKLILKRLMERPDDAAPVSFYKCEKKDGYLSIITANDKSRDWLLTEVKGIKAADGGVDLTAMLEINLPRIHKVSLTLPASDELTFDQIVKVLQRCNENLDIKNWKCVSTVTTTTEDNATKAYTIVINESAKKQLQKNGHKLFYKFGQVQFKSVIEPTKNQAATQNGQAKVAPTTPNGKVEPTKAEQKK